MSWCKTDTDFNGIPLYWKVHVNAAFGVVKPSVTTMWARRWVQRSIRKVPIIDHQSEYRNSVAARLLWPKTWLYNFNWKKTNVAYYLTYLVIESTVVDRTFINFDSMNARTLVCCHSFLRIRGHSGCCKGFWSKKSKRSDRDRKLDSLTLID